MLALGYSLGLLPVSKARGLHTARIGDETERSCPMDYSTPWATWAQFRNDLFARRWPSLDEVFDDGAIDRQALQGK